MQRGRLRPRRATGARGSKGEMVTLLCMWKNLGGDMGTGLPVLTRKFSKGKAHETLAAALAFH
ncbi:hypothetical protein F2P79_024955 [Pimephales promelas]|nr:hypothetical protein F2P79_024955 [Pimephales promelas]